MPNDHDGRHEGGSIVDTAQANTSPEELKREGVLDDTPEGRQEPETEKAEPDSST